MSSPLNWIRECSRGSHAGSWPAAGLSVRQMSNDNAAVTAVVFSGPRLVSSPPLRCFLLMLLVLTKPPPASSAGSDYRTVVVYTVMHLLVEVWAERGTVRADRWRDSERGQAAVKGRGCESKRSVFGLWGAPRRDHAGHLCQAYGTRLRWMHTGSTGICAHFSFGSVCNAVCSRDDGPLTLAGWFPDPSHSPSLLKNICINERKKIKLAAETHIDCQAYRKCVFSIIHLWKRSVLI